MPPPNRPTETSESQAGEREAVKASITEKLTKFTDQINEAYRKKVTDLIQLDLSETSLKNIDALLSAAQQEFSKDPQKISEILNTMIRLGGNGEFTKEELAQALGVPQVPEAMQKVNVAIGKLTTIMEGFTEQLGGLGSGTMKMLETMFGSNTLFGRIFAFLKNTPKAQEAYVLKKLGEQQKTLAPETNVQAVVNMLRAQVVQGQNIERTAKRAPTYDLVQHTDQLMALLDPKVDPITFEAMQSAGQTAIGNYSGQIQLSAPPAQPPATPAETPSPELVRERNNVTTPKFETEISTTDPTKMGAEFQNNEFAMTIDSTQKKITKIDGKTIDNVSVIKAVNSAPAAIIFKLKDGPEIQIEATALKAAKPTDKKATVAARNLTTKSDASLEIQFT